MLLNNISDIPSPIKHIYLSPHFDDAALSVGGIIAAQHAAGEQTLVVTVCSAPPSGPLNSFAAHLHQQWGAMDDPIANRRQEDQAAISILNAHLIWLDYQDAIYRHENYNSVEAIFADPVEDDLLKQQLLPELLSIHQHIPHAQWYAPLAIGNHVDHQVVHGVAQQLQAQQIPTLWYEDLPYAARKDAYLLRMQTLPVQAAYSIDISSTLETKLASIAAYQSQIIELFGDLQHMQAEISGYAHKIAIEPMQAVERLWRLNEI